MAACYLASILVISFALWRWGAAEVRGHLGEVLGLTIFGIFWLIVCLHLFSWFGLCIGDDALERRNPAALIGCIGATLAVAFIYAAGNFGEGPSYWNNVFSEGVGTLGFFALWLGLEIGGRVSRTIAEERDIAGGIRFGAFAIAAGLILARAIAGDWHSAQNTVHDFVRDGWPAAVLMLFAAAVERLLRPNRAHPVRPWISCGLLPAIIYLVCACVWLVHLGRWEGMPR